jgi:N4-gp56 family major capsid protein
VSETTLATASEKQVWMRNYFKEYVRNSRFAPYMGRSPTSIIFVKYELQEEAGKTINLPLITRLKEDGVTGSQVLDGNEEELGNYNCPITVDWRRHGIRVPKSTSFKTEIGLLDAARPMLRQWESEKLRDDIIKALISVVIADTSAGGATVNIGDSTAANRNAFAAGNQDRIVAGKVLSNYSATWATMTGNLDTTDDKCTISTMSLAKRVAEQADPHIRPYQVEDGEGEEWFIAFHGGRTFRDLKLDTTLTDANREARPREGGSFMRNPLFKDGDVVYDGIIHRKVPEIDAICTNSGGTYSFDNAGSGGTTDVRPVMLCGQQAVGIAWGQEPTPRTDRTKDYEFRPGVAIEELLGVKKMAFNSKQHGCVMVLFAAAADS